MLSILSPDRRLIIHGSYAALVLSLFSVQSVEVFVVVVVCVLKATEVRHGPLFVLVCLSLILFFGFSVACFSPHHEKKRLLLCPQPPLQLPLCCFCMRSSVFEKGPLFFFFQAIFHCWCQWAVSIYSEGNWGEKQVAAEVHPLISLLFFERARASRWAGQNAHNVYFIPRYTNTMWVLVAHCACRCSNPSPNAELRARAGRGPSFSLLSPLFFFSWTTLPPSLV